MCDLVGEYLLIHDFKLSGKAVLVLVMVGKIIRK